MQLQYTIITCLKEDKQKSTESCAAKRKLTLFTLFLKYAKLNCWKIEFYWFEILLL